MPPTAWVLGFLGAFGLVVIWRGLRGAPRLSAPHCAQCRYDLRVSLRQGRDRCPECGAMLGRPTAVRFGRRPRSAAIIGLGLLLVMPAVLYGTSVIVKRSTGFRWQQIQSTSFLITVLDDPRAARDASAVLETRYMDGELSDEDVADVVEVVIASMGRGGQVNRSHATDGLIQMAHQDGRIVESQWLRLIEVLFARPPVVTCRHSVRTGQHLDFRVHGSSSRLANLMRLRPVIQIERATFDDVDVPLEEGARTNSRLAVEAPPGEYTLELHLDVAIVDAGALMKSAPMIPDGPSLQHRWKAVVSAPVTVLRADEYPFERIDDAATVDAFRESLHVVRATAVPDHLRSALTVEVTLQMEMPDDVALSYEVIVRADGREERIGDFRASERSFACSCRPLNRASRRTGTLRLLFDRSVPLHEDTDRIDLILRPDLEGAERDQQLERLLDAEIVIEDVPLED